ncbi:MAG TPA: helix-turn-helix domain-containing protein [Clostridia bacterium]|nr:helix-turn-helix domain-containing protein [Clostridia bacterium]
MEQMIQVLRRFNYTESEVKVYIALLQNGPNNGYEVSKLSGVPRSKVYNILEMLVNRGVVVTSQSNKNVIYRAEPVHRLINLIQTSVEESVRELAQEAAKFTHSFDDEQIWKLSEYQSIMDKCKEMISNAKSELMIQIWEPELIGDIERILLEKEKKLKLLVILYDNTEGYHTHLTQVYRHGFEEDKMHETGYRWITIIADEEEMLHASVHSSTSSEAIYTRNASMVFFAKEYVRHDAYCLRLIDAFPEQVRKRFGENMEEIRNVFAIQ